jgi:hypothetical protein
MAGWGISAYNDTSGTLNLQLNTWSSPILVGTSVPGRTPIGNLEDISGGTGSWGRCAW